MKPAMAPMMIRVMMKPSTGTSCGLGGAGSAGTWYPIITRLNPRPPGVRRSGRRRGPAVRSPHRRAEISGVGVENPAAPAARTTGDGDATSRVLAGLAALYALLAAVQLVALTGTARLLLVAAATVSGTILAGGGLWLRRRRRQGRAAPDWIEAFAVVPLAACLLRVGVTGDLEQ